MLQLLILFLSLIAASAASCNRTCGKTTVPYPFGFSPSCHIPLSCNSGISFSGFPLHNITANNTFLLNFSANCTRPVTSASVFFSSNYALTRTNGLLLQNCTPSTTSPCLLPTMVFSQMSHQLSSCALKEDNLTCFFNNTGNMYLKNDDLLNKCSCGDVFSSIMYEPYVTGQTVLALGIVEIGWWMMGNCHCSANASCTRVGSEVKDGYWCKCDEGFIGDGFADGDGCRRDLPSSPSHASETAGSVIVPDLPSSPSPASEPAGSVIVPDLRSSPSPASEPAGSVIVPDLPSSPSPASETAGSVIVPGTVTMLPKKSITTIIVSVVGGVATLLVVITICIWFQRKWSISDGTKLFLEELQEVAASEFLIYDFTTIRNATNNFSDKNKLGRGGFGPVYKGNLPNGQEIAVKRLSTSSTQGATEFKTEVELLVRLRHKNLVQLLGCCISKDERILCYEYLPNGSLDNILFGTDDNKCRELEWSRRYRIIKGICRGLLYLHEESPLKIVHRDLKASNILLDRDMNPKIADFGLARLFDRDQTHTVTAHFAGTFGYIAPEYSIRGTFSAKSDAYSFGILVLEILSGRKNSSFPGSEYMSGLINHVWKSWSEGKVVELKDPTLDQECIEEVTKCIHIALLCLQKNPSDRPNMETVANMLNSSSIAILPPLPPPRFIWGADVPMFEDDENVVANLSREYSVVGIESAVESFLSSFNRRA